MPLFNFIKIVTTGDLVWLGEVDSPQQVWQSIFMDYLDIMPSKNSVYVRQITGEIEHLKTKIDIIQTMLNRLRVSYLPELIPILNEYGFYYAFTPDTMFEDLQNVTAECQQFVVQKGVKEGEYKRFIEGQAKDEAKETDFDEILADLSKHQGYHLRSKDLSVSEFVAIFNQYKKQSE